MTYKLSLRDLIGFSKQDLQEGLEERRKLKELLEKDLFIYPPKNHYNADATQILINKYTEEINIFTARLYEKELFKGNSIHEAKTRTR